MTTQELINETQLLHANKADLIEAMQEVGIDVADTDPLSVIAERMKEAGGECCITKIATVGLTDDGGYHHRFFTLEEWQSMDASLQQNYPRIGVLLIAEGQRLIIAKSDQTSTDEGTDFTMRWSTATGDIPGLKDYSESTYGMILDYDTKPNMETMLSYAESRPEGFFIAPLQANQYRGCLNDPTYWCLASMGHMFLIGKYRDKINEALGVIGAMNISSGNHWTSTPRNADSVWALNPVTMVVSSFNNNKIATVSGPSRVRPVAVV